MTRPLLELSDVHKAFGGLNVSVGVNMEVRRGETHALIGPNGAGKTTLIGQICGEILPDRGRIVLEGEDITRLPVHRRARLGLARSYQITSLMDALSVFDNALLAVMAHYGTPWRMFRSARNDEKLRDAAIAILARVDLGEHADRIAGELSHGLRRQLELAMTLAGHPRLLLLDEPMAGLGPRESARMIELLQELKEEHSILLVEHDMDAVFALADRISVLVAGRLIATGTPQEVRADREVRRAYLGEDADAA